MGTKSITAVIVIAATALLIGYDIFVAIEPTPGDTISAVLLNCAWSHSVIAWYWGGLSGHLFWPMTLHHKEVAPIPFAPWMFPWRTYKWVALAILILVTISLTVLDIAGKLPIHPAALLVAGIPAGHLGWPQMKAKWRDK